MLLTLKPPLQNGVKEPHEYPSLLNSNSRYSPPTARTGPSPAAPEGADRRMSNPHRGLPPPAGMTLPPPDRALPAMAPLSQLSAPSPQWNNNNNNEESSRNWYLAKVEEDRRRQEEEKTKQEGLRLDQRKIEQSILVESLHNGVPPYMVPIIFAGMGGGNLSQTALDLAQQYMSQLSLQQQQHQQQMHIQSQVHQQTPNASAQPAQSSPDLRRDSRMIPPNPYGGHQAPLQPAMSTAPPAPSAPPSQGQLGRPAAPTSAARGSSQSTLPRLNTTEVHQQNAHHSTHPLHQSQTAQQEMQQQSSPSIYFHHYVPPPQQSNTNQPSTPSGKSQHGSPFSQNQQSHLRSEYQSSPKKRKATGAHQAAPPPTSQPSSDTSPPFSQGSSRETPPEGRKTSPGGGGGGGSRRGGRRRSDASARGFHQDVLRPSSRQQQREAAEAGTLSAPKPSTPHGYEPGSAEESRQNVKVEEDAGRKEEDEAFRSGNGQRAYPDSRSTLSRFEGGVSRGVDMMAGPSLPLRPENGHLSTILTRKLIE